MIKLKNILTELDVNIPEPVLNIKNCDWDFTEIDDNEHFVFFYNFDYEEQFLNTDGFGYKAGYENIYINLHIDTIEKNKGKVINVKDTGGKHHRLKLDYGTSETIIKEWYKHE
jgi:hypothetical protein